MWVIVWSCLTTSFENESLESCFSFTWFLHLVFREKREENCVRRGEKVTLFLSSLWIRSLKSHPTDDQKSRYVFRWALSFLLIRISSSITQLLGSSRPKVRESIEFIVVWDQFDSAGLHLFPHFLPPPLDDVEVKKATLVADPVPVIKDRIYHFRRFIAAVRWNYNWLEEKRCNLLMNLFSRWQSEKTHRKRHIIRIISCWTLIKLH